MSKFKGIFEDTAAEGQETETQMMVMPAQLPVSPVRGSGKRIDPQYTEVSANVGRETYRKVKVALVMAEERDFSDLVDELLRGWLAARG